ncbi:MAG: serine/threonine protein kinase [Variovorax sp.]|nr:MAG: serine/threonine protein kinase [Variovorax sp.]
MGITCAHCGAVNRSVATFCVQCDAGLPTLDMGTRTRDDTESIPTAAYDGAGPFTQTRVEDSPYPRPASSEHALPTGTLIEGFRIEQVIGEGGFGIVYLAWDAALERQVAIKEYMPFALASRADSLFEVSVRSERSRETFEAGLKSFVNEARLLARFDHPALLKVLRFWNGNRTAYMAMPYYEGPTLKAALAARGASRPTESELREWLDPLLDALSVLHDAQCYHRDISPDNILLTRAGPLLLDFGAARRVITDMTQALTAVLKPGFAPIEQYGGVMSQGPWTDLYALAGVVYYAITGRPPMASVARVVEDGLKPLSITHAGQYSEEFLRAIDAALAIRPEARPQDVTRFRLLLDAPRSPPPPPPLPPPPALARAATPTPTPAAAPGPAAQTEKAPSRAPAPRSRRGIAAGLLAIAVASVGAWAWWGPTPRTAATVQAPAPSPAPAAVTATPAPVPVPPPAPASVPTPASAAPSVATATATATAPAPAPAPAAARPRPPSTPLPTVSAKAADAVRATAPERESAPARTPAGKPARCGEIVQKSTLESLNPEEIDYLKKACR